MFFQPVPGCHYPLGVILLSLQWVREGLSLRGVSRQWETWMVLRDLPWWGPHPTTIRLWVLRYGHWELTRPKEPADDGLWVIDHSEAVKKWDWLRASTAENTWKNVDSEVPVPIFSQPLRAVRGVENVC
jgi:hypothetical protein